MFPFHLSGLEPVRFLLVVGGGEKSSLISWGKRSNHITTFLQTHSEGNRSNNIWYQHHPLWSES